jgi:hypothetical protein
MELALKSGRGGVSKGPATNFFVIHTAMVSVTSSPCCVAALECFYVAAPQRPLLERWAPCFQVDNALCRSFFTATDTAKVSAERANLALRILPESISRIISMSYTDFFHSLRRYVCVFLTVK